MITLKIISPYQTSGLPTIVAKVFCDDPNTKDRCVFMILVHLHLPRRFGCFRFGCYDESNPKSLYSDLSLSSTFRADLIFASFMACISAEDNSFTPTLL